MRENWHFKGNKNCRRAITAHPAAPRAKFAQAGIKPHGMESGIPLEFQKSQGITQTTDAHGCTRIKTKQKILAVATPAWLSGEAAVL